MCGISINIWGGSGLAIQEEKLEIFYIKIHAAAKNRQLESLKSYFSTWTSFVTADSTRYVYDSKAIETKELRVEKLIQWLKRLITFVGLSPQNHNEFVCSLVVI